MRIVLATSGTTLSTPTFESKGSQKTKRKERVEKFPNMKKKITTQVQEAQRVPYRISQRETHQDTFNQTNKN